MAGKPLSYTLPARLEAKMTEMGITVRDLAQRAGINEQKLYDNLSGQYRISLETSLQLMTALGYDINRNPALAILQELSEQHTLYKVQKENAPTTIDMKSRTAPNPRKKK